MKYLAAFLVVIILSGCGSTSAEDCPASFYACREQAELGDAEGARWYRLAAEQGHADSQLAFGGLHVNGQGVPKDEAESVRWARLAAEQGQVYAAFVVAMAYEYGMTAGVPKDKAEAPRWYRLAAEQGDATSQKELGYLYESGDGVPRDNTEALRWHRLAAEQGHADELALKRLSIASSATSVYDLVSEGRFDRIQVFVQVETYEGVQRGEPTSLIAIEEFCRESPIESLAIVELLRKEGALSLDSLVGPDGIIDSDRYSKLIFANVAALEHIIMNSKVICSIRHTPLGIELRPN